MVYKLPLTFHEIDGCQFFVFSNLVETLEVKAKSYPRVFETTNENSIIGKIAWVVI